MSIFPKVISSIQGFSGRIWQTDSKIHIEMQRIQNNQTHFEKEEKVGRLPLSDFKTYKVIVHKTVGYLYNDTQKDQQKKETRTRSSRIWTADFDKCAKLNHWRKDSLFTYSAGTTECKTKQKDLISYLAPH